MYSAKFIQIRKERSVEQRLASIWLDACEELEIPCILIYQSNWNAYISLNTKFIPEILTEQLKSVNLQQELMQLQQKYTTTTAGYCQHSNTYHTFDSIPNDLATQIAAEIYDTIMTPAINTITNLKAEHQLIA